MRGVAYALLAAGVLALGALTPVSASADCYRDCEGGYRSGASHHHHHHHSANSSHLRYVRYERYERRPVHHHVHRTACCDEGYRPHHFLRSRYEEPRYRVAIDSRPRYRVADVETLDDDDDVLPSYSAYSGGCCGGYVRGYYDQTYYRPYYSRPSYPNGYYISGIGGYGGGYRGLVFRGGYHRLGGFPVGQHGFGGFRYAGFGGYHGHFHGHR